MEIRGKVFEKQKHGMDSTDRFSSLLHLCFLGCMALSRASDKPGTANHIFSRSR